MKKTLFALVLLVILIYGCAPIDKKAPEIKTTESDIEPGLPPVLPELQQTETAKEILSELKCINNTRIEGVITNIQEQSLTFTKDLKVIVNGLIVIDPECDKTTLEPGESTFCADLSGHYNVRADRVNTIKISLLRENVIEDIECK